MGDEIDSPETGALTVAGIDIPADFTVLDEAAINTLKGKVAKAFTKIDAKEKLTAEELTDLGKLTEVMGQIRGAETAFGEAAAEAATKRAEYAAAMAEANPTEPVEGEPVASEGGAPAEPVAAAVEVPPVAEITDPEIDKEEAAAVSVIESLAASLRGNARGVIRTSPRPVAASRTRVPEREGGGVTIIASSGITGTDTGSVLDRDGLSTALHARARMMGDVKGKGSDRFGALVASVKLDSPTTDVRNLESDVDIRKAWDKSNRDYTANVESHVASGGFCSPSETIYDFVCDFEAMPEVLDLPSITAQRGGVRFPTSPLLGDVLEDVDSGFTWTEDDDIAAALPGGPTKPCFTIPCPDFDEIRLQAQGICVTAGNLMDRAYPELTKRYIDLVFTAHAHRMNGLTIAKVVAESTPVAPIVADLSATEAILASIELQIAASRDQFFMGEGEVLEVVLPRWIRTVMRRDLARRAGVDYQQADNSMLASFFGEIGARVQFVSNWQSLRRSPNTVPAGPALFAGMVSLPTQVLALIYPAGSHTRLDGGSLDLGVVRDSTLNSTNDYTAAWTEEFWQVLSRCFSLIVTIPICANGSAGALVTIDCPTA